MYSNASHELQSSLSTTLCPVMMHSILAAAEAENKSELPCTCTLRNWGLSVMAYGDIPGMVHIYGETSRVGDFANTGSGLTPAFGPEIL